MPKSKKSNVSLVDIISNKSLQKKVLISLGLLFLYRLLVFIPVPFVNIDQLMQWVNNGWSKGLEFFALLMWWTLEQFSIIAVGLIAYINASIIMQLLTAIVPKLDDLQQQGEGWTMKIQQYTRWLAVPLAFLQSIGMIFFISSILPGVINTADWGVVLNSAFVMTVSSVILMWIWELITEKWVSNGISLIIFASIVAWIIWKTYTFVSASNDAASVLLFILAIVIGLIILTLYLVKTIKEIPVIYARQWKVTETSVLPIPLNPVGMVPIIFAISFVSFPYLLSQIVLRMHSTNAWLNNTAHWIEQNMNIYSQNPAPIAIIIFFLLIIIFTFFYTLIVFNPEKMALNIQQRWGYIPSVRPWEETAKYLNKILMQLSLWWWIGLWLVWIYTYVLHYIPVVSDAIMKLGSLPVIVSGSWIVIIVWVVQEIMNKAKADALMNRYDQL